MRMGLALATALACGCISMGKKVSKPALAQIQVGVSTRTDVERLLGAPRTISQAPTSQTTLMYWHWKGSLTPPGRLLGIGRLWEGGSSRIECVTITVDCNGKVSDVSTSTWEQKGGDGILDRNRQSFSGGKLDASDPCEAETVPASP